MHELVSERIGRAVGEAMAAADGAIPHRLLRTEVDSWFTAEGLEEILGPAETETEAIARAWVARSGKRWRPFLTACTFQALQTDSAAPVPESLRRVAVAVECFHKASLIHDDIEDEDALRDGQATLHEQYGVPIALNVGDFLLGEGYRLIASSGLAADRRAEMLRVAAAGHRTLAIGQGSELWWAYRPTPLGTEEVLGIFRRKTAPAFEVALRFGAIAAGADDDVWDVLHRYSESLGIAYQIGDDLKDRNGLLANEAGGPAQALRPSILLAIAHGRAEGEDKRLLEAVWRRTRGAAPHEWRGLLARLKVEEEARRLLASYEEDALCCLEPLAGARLKNLLRRVLFQIFHEVEP
jgi:geranylgeranyl pyrophosphate synthase